MNNTHFLQRWCLLLLLLGTMTVNIRAQEQNAGMSLQQCIQFGLANNPNVLKSQVEAERYDEQKVSTRAAFLPQVQGSASLNDNLKLQTSIIPGEFFGQPGEQIAVQFGTKYNVNLGIDASQILYDHSLIYAAKISNQATELANLNTQKTKEQLTYDIAAVYYSAQIARTQMDIVRSNLTQVDTLLNITQSQYANDFAQQLDIDRLLVNKTNLETNLTNAELQYNQQIRLLKLYMGMPQSTQLSIPPIDSATQSAMLTDTESVNKTDLSILQTQQQLYELNMRQIKSGYIPTLSLAFHTGVQLQQNNLRIFSEDADWFPNSYIAVQLAVPIFDGLSKSSRIKQVKLQMEQNELDQRFLNESLVMQRDNAVGNLQINRATLESQQRNTALAQSVYNTTRERYTGGISSMAELVNAETALKTAQTNYLSALVQVKLAELELLKATGNIASFN